MEEKVAAQVEAIRKIKKERADLRALRANISGFADVKVFVKKKLKLKTFETFTSQKSNFRNFQWLF
jgi:hypothetical protein